MKIFNDIGFHSLSAALDGLSLRQRITSDNIANVDTPGYKAQFVKFEEQLQMAINNEPDGLGLPLTTTNSGHLPFNAVPATNLIEVGQNENDLRNDANNVDIDLEMTTLAETTLRYQSLAQLATNKLSFLRNIVRG